MWPRPIREHVLDGSVPTLRADPSLLDLPADWPARQPQRPPALTS
jgi:hypothetical protein